MHPRCVRILIMPITVGVSTRATLSHATLAKETAAEIVCKGVSRFLNSVWGSS